jgi:hypothetical protein
VGHESDFLSDLQRSVEAVRSSPDGGKHGNAAIYGLSGSMPCTGPINEMLVLYNDVVLTV